MKAPDKTASFASAFRLYQEGQFQAALDTLSTMLLKRAEGEPSWFALMGNIRFKMGEKEAAGDAFVREVSVSPASAEAMLKIAVALYAQCGASQKIHALADKAIAVLSGDASTMHLVGEACLAANDMHRLKSLLDKLDRFNPQHVTLVYHYHHSMGDRQAAWTTLTEGVRNCPNDLFLRVTRYAEARVICDFDTMREYEALMEEPDTPLASALLSGEMALNRLFWTRSEAMIARPSHNTNVLLKQTEALSMLRHPRRAISPPGRKLKVAYLSGDFSQHAVMMVFNEALCKHDPERLDLTILCHGGPAAQEWQRRNWPRHLIDATVSVHERPTVEVLDIIRRREIDILVDLMGHTAGSRLDIVNLCDAPLRAGYLGYPASATAVELDYCITDAFITPESSRGYYAQKLCLLPGTSMPNNSLETCSPKPANRADYKLPADRFVFCSFNAVFKISPRTLTLWARVLEMAPQSVLWIRCDGELARRNLLSGLAAEGIAADRIIFAEAVSDYQTHISRVALADLSLDTMPYNGHATTTDMLRAGVPVVALRGTTSPARMSDGLLHAVGMADLVATDEAGFAAIAANLALDPVLYNAVRLRLWQNRLTSPLFDPALFALHLESAFEMMAERARKGLAPDHITVPAITAGEKAQEAAE